MRRVRALPRRLAEALALRLLALLDPPPDALVRRVREWSLPGTIARNPGPGLLDIGEHSPYPRIIRFIGDDGIVRIGKWCSIEATAQIFVGGEHPTDWVSMHPLRLTLGLPGALEDGLPYSKGPVVIGNDVWLGWESIVMSGVTIGDGAVVAARAVVTKDVEPYSIVAGVPARHIRWRFPDEQRAALQRIAWWDWPEEKIKANVGALLNPDIEAFIAAHDPVSERP